MPRLALLAVLFVVATGAGAAPLPKPKPKPGFAPVPSAPPPSHPIKNPIARFAGLDKITGRIIAFDAKIGETVKFGTLLVTPRICLSRPPSETPRTDSFVQVDALSATGPAKRIFSGWMFAASPGLNGVEHPVYDVWLTDCVDPHARKPAPVVAPAPKGRPAAKKVIKKPGKPSGN